MPIRPVFPLKEMSGGGAYPTWPPYGTPTPFYMPNVDMSQYYMRPPFMMPHMMPVDSKIKSRERSRDVSIDKVKSVKSESSKSKKSNK